MPTLIRRAPYNHEVVVADRWRIPYAPAYGWPEYVRGIYKAVVRTDPAYSHEMQATGRQYLSNACIHEHHDQCDSECPYCNDACRCACHGR